MAADRLIALGGKLSQPHIESVKALKQALPFYCSFANPLDIFEDATPERFKSALQICLCDSKNSGVIVIFTPQGATDAIDLAKVVVAASRQTQKPVLVALTGESDNCREARALLHRNGVPAFRTPEEAVSTFMYMWLYTQNL
jgi:acetyltransferase